MKTRPKSASAAPSLPFESVTQATAVLDEVDALACQGDDLWPDIVALDKYLHELRTLVDERVSEHVWNELSRLQAAQNDDDAWQNAMRVKGVLKGIRRRLLSELEDDEREQERHRVGVHRYTSELADCYECPHCGQIARTTPDATVCVNHEWTPQSDVIVVEHQLAVCPNPSCGELSVVCKVSTRTPSQASDSLESTVLFEQRVYPGESEPILPDSVPQRVRQSYKEALAVQDRSNNAVGMLCRRVIEGVLDDFYGLDMKKLSLADALKELRSRDDVRKELLAAMTKVKDVGNVGAHFRLRHNLLPEDDLDSLTAGTLLRFLPILFRITYMSRDEEMAAMRDVEALGDASAGRAPE